MAMESDKRLRTLSERGDEMFQETKAKHVKHLEEAWKPVERLVERSKLARGFTIGSLTEEECRELHRGLCFNYGEFRLVLRRYREFLIDTRTETSEQLVLDLNAYDKKCDDIVEEAFRRVTESNQPRTEMEVSETERDAEGREGGGSNSSKLCGSSKSRAMKHEAAKARFEFAKKELELKKAILEAELKMVEEERLFAESKTEAYTLSETGSIRPPTEEETDSVKRERTQQYVDSCQNVQETSRIDNPLNPTAPPFVPAQDGSRMFEELGRFLVKKDLLLQRFYKFNDEPTTFYTWKNSFKAVVTELNCSATEEIDLLLRWLGPESSKQAMNLRAANIHDPEEGLRRIWERLGERYGAPEYIENSIRNRLAVFPRISSGDNSKLFELCDILSEIQCVKANPLYSTMFSYYDSPVGINPIVNKLPVHLQNKWADRGRDYKARHMVSYPPFDYFVVFMKEMCNKLNDPSFNFDRSQASNVEKHTRYSKPVKINTNKGDVSVTNAKSKCPLHTQAAHTLDECKEFRKKPIEERRQFLKDNRLCFRCVRYEHRIKDCRVMIKCLQCQSSKHTTALHIDKIPPHKGEKRQNDVCKSDVQATHTDIVNCKCTKFCNDASVSKSCAKMVKVNVFHKDKPSCKVKMYVVLDDQSNRSLASSVFFDTFGDVCDYKDVDYTLSSCGGKVITSGRTGEGFVVESMDGQSFKLPIITECQAMPDNRSEIPTPHVAQKYAHLQRIADRIPELDEGANIMLLLGRDIPEVHHVHDQIIGLDGPYAQQLALGWVLIGESCLKGAHAPYVNVNKISIRDGRPSVLPACESAYTVKHVDETIGSDLFLRQKDDNRVGTSIEDRAFLKIMADECKKADTGHWEAPLPFQEDRSPLPNNRDIALKRALLLDANLKRNPTKAKHFVEFMAKVLKSGAAVIAPEEVDDVWYLPIFGVYHPKKPDKIRGVFDSSALCKGRSLNGELLSGPNLTNSLVAVLLCFRKDACAVIADIEQMFYSFLVKASHRDYLRFFWYCDNDLGKPLVEYRMRVHVFGNSPSPAVATYCLRKTVEDADRDVRNFVNDNFYVDDGLISLPEVDDAISLVKRTQECLKTANVRLHKIASNNTDVMKMFPEDDLQSDLKSLNLDTDKLPVNSSLGLHWVLSTDSLMFNLSLEHKPYTRRGLLSTINSVYDPLGFAAPVILSGKILLREIATGYGWDEPLSPDMEKRWNSWRDSLHLLGDVQIPRMFVPQSLSTSYQKELHIFSDASEKAVSAVAYIRTLDNLGNESIGFAMGKSKLAPVHGHTIPRLELCAALLAAELGDLIIEALGLKFDTVKYYTDSRVVLGYISNTSRRFYNYVSNRVERILSFSKAEQWNYISSNKNPADIGSRGCSSAEQLSLWLQGTDLSGSCEMVGNTEAFPLVSPDNDKEVRREVTVNVNKTAVERCISEKFEKFSSWERLVKAFSLLRIAVRNFKSKKGTVDGLSHKSLVGDLKDTELFIIKVTQERYFGQELKCLQSSKSISKDSPICSLNPFLDENGVLRVGGRIRQSGLPTELVHPILLPNKDHVSMLMVRHFHEVGNHQGRHLTEGKLREEGYWIVGAKKLVSKLIHSCVVCRKLRGKSEHQIMADLPADRLTPGPPFSFVGVDVFGPWEVVARRTRGGLASCKRWAVLFSCLVTRAVHIEVLEDMSSSSLINALRRFIALRGNVKEFRSDRGTNFVGAMEDLQYNVINVEEGPVENYLSDSRITWRFNPPHSSHMGGVWERMIGMARRILDGLLVKHCTKNLTHEVLVTFMAEVVAVMNSRPITAISNDAEDPIILTPSMLLNQKINGDSAVCFDLNVRDIYKKQWKMVQVLSDLFWKKWKEDYLSTLQKRSKWQQEKTCVKNGDVILLKDKGLARQDWAVGIVSRVIPSESDKLVRKAEVCIIRNGKRTTLTRPITEMVVLVD